MIKWLELAKFAELHRWLVVDKATTENEDYIQFLTPAGQKIIVWFKPDGSVERIYP